MPSRKEPIPAQGNGRPDDASDDAEHRGALEDALSAAEEAEAEAAEAEAVAAAARARARAIRLRREATAAEAANPATAAEAAKVDTETTASDGDTETTAAADKSMGADGEAPQVAEASEDTASDSDTETDTADEVKPARRLRLPRVGWKPVAAGLAVFCTLGLLAASGFMIWHHQQAQARAQRTAEFAAAARQGVVTLMSLDHTRADEDVQRIIDSSTGQFREDFEDSAKDFAAVARDSKVTTEATVNATAVDEMTDDTASVLVAATSRITNAAGAKEDPRSWRLKVDLARDGDQIKMSKVEFVP